MPARSPGLRPAPLGRSLPFPVTCPHARLRDFLVFFLVETGVEASSLVVEPLHLTGGNACSARRPADNLVRSLDFHLWVDVISVEVVQSESLGLRAANAPVPKLKSVRSSVGSRAWCLLLSPTSQHPFYCGAVWSTLAYNRCFLARLGGASCRPTKWRACWLQVRACWCPGATALGRAPAKAWCPYPDPGCLYSIEPLIGPSCMAATFVNYCSRHASS